MTDDISEFALSCPIPKQKFSTIQMAHGGGGRQMRDLIEGIFRPAFTPEGTTPGIPHDASLLEIATSGRGKATIAMTTDTFVVNPVFFPGGDIGHLAVCGTVNDLAVSGARPLALSAGFILEEGFLIESLEKICVSIARASAEAGVSIITGDTKVVDRGKADGIYIKHGRHRIGRRGCSNPPDRGPPRRRGNSQRRFGPSRHGDNVGPRRAQLQWRPRKRLRFVGRTLRKTIAGGAGNPLPFAT